VVARDVILAQVAMSGMRAVAGFMAALVVFAFRKQGAPVIWYGLVAVASVGGNFGGALAAPRLRSRFSERLLMASAAGVIAVTAVGVTQLAGLDRRPAALMLAFVIGLGASIAKAAFDAIVQAETRDSDRSRLFARFEAIFQLVWVCGALIPTLINIPLLAGYIMVAVIVIGCSASFVFGVAKGATAPKIVHAPVTGPAPSSPADGSWADDPPPAPPGGSWGSAPEPYPNPGPPPALPGPG
jgi:hypothetical protein